MKIGVFDSGLGGLYILKELRKKFRNYDFVYLGDTKNLPYGEKSEEEIFELTKNACEYLFRQDCVLVIVACNTASSVLKKLQQNWLAKSKYRTRKILGIIRPTAEQVVEKKYTKVGLIGTNRTLHSKIYFNEFVNEDSIKIYPLATPRIVPMIESGKIRSKDLRLILKPLLDLKIQALILACTHYGMIKNQIKAIFGNKITIIAQEDLLPNKLSRYLLNHQEIKNQITQNKSAKLLVTKKSPRYSALIKKWFGTESKITAVKY